MPLQYHKILFELCEFNLDGLSRNFDEINKWEQIIGTILPESIKEFYSILNAKVLIKKYLQRDRMFWINNVVAPLDNFITIMEETQGVYIWAAELNGTMDPPVRVKIFNGQSYGEWRPYTNSFSEFLLARAFEYIHSEYPSIQSDFIVQTVSDDELKCVKAYITPIVISTNAPSDQNYYCVDRDRSTFLIFYRGKDSPGSEWHLWAKTEEKLKQILHLLKLCKPEILEVLYSDDDIGNAVLEDFRR